MRILVTRPDPDASEQADEFRRKGHDVVCAPMLNVVFKDPGLAHDEGDLAGVIVTSRNAVRSLQRHPAAPTVLAQPVYCVGPGTAKLAKAHGFSNVIEGNGNADDLASLIQQTVNPDDGVLLRLTGKIPSEAPGRLTDTLAGAGYALRDAICYEVTAATTFTEDARRFLSEDHLIGIVLMSPLTAKSFQDCLCNDGLTVQSGKFRYICLSKAVADALSGVPSEHLFVADTPNRAGLGSILDRAVSDLS